MKRIIDILIDTTFFFLSFVFGFIFLVSIFFLKNTLLKTVFLVLIIISYIYHLIIRKNKPELFSNIGKEKGDRFPKESSLFLSAVCFVGFGYSFISGILRNFFPIIPNVLLNRVASLFLGVTTPFFFVIIIFLIEFIVQAVGIFSLFYFSFKFAKKYKERLNNSAIKIVVTVLFFIIILVSYVLLINKLLGLIITETLFIKLLGSSAARELVNFLFGVPVFGYYRFLYGKTRFFQGYET